MSNDGKKELREYALSIKNAAPERVIAEVGLEKRWRIARNKAIGNGGFKGDEYLRTLSGTYVLEYILGVQDMSVGVEAALRIQKAKMEMVEKAGIMVPRGASLLDLGRG